MKEIKYILSLLMLTISSMVYSQSTSPYYVRVLHVLNNESVVDTYILPSQLDSITFANYYNVSAISSDESKGVVTVDNSLVFQGNNVTLTANATEGHELYNWTLNGEVVSTENPYYPVVTQNAEYVANFGPIRPEIVDLGLPSGLKWASFNLGALSPEQAGDYYMWGETFPRTEFVSDATNSLYTYTDNPDVLPLSADAANVTLQGNFGECLQSRSGKSY